MTPLGYVAFHTGQASTAVRQSPPPLIVGETLGVIIPADEYDAMLAELTRYRTLTEDARAAYMTVMGSQVADAHEDGDES